MYSLFYNTNVQTLDNNSPDCSSLLIENNQIIFCGNENDINLPDAELKKINLNGFTILPSFIDCHTHFAMAAKKMDQISLDHCLTFDETIQEIKNNIYRFEKGTWIKGGGWNANLWKGVIPNRKQLDTISDEHPIALFNKDLHTLWLNSLALNICGFDSDIPSHLKSKIHIGDDGKPNGLIIEDACQIVQEKSTSNSASNIENNLIQFSDQLLKAGITSVNSMENLDDFDHFMRLHKEKKLKTRICCHPPAEDVETVIESGIYSGLGNSWVKFGGLKYYVDGSLGSQTAEMFENFEGLDHAGIEVLSEKDLEAKVKHAAEKGLSATIHAIGDKANHKTLNAIENTKTEIKSEIDLRHRIEHSQILKETDIQRFAELGIIASMQPLHIADDVKISDKYLGNRAIIAYPINSLLKAGTKVVFGSDTPVADFNPIKGIQAAISRRYNLDPDEESWYPDEKITIRQAIAAYTRNAAYASYDESLKGILQPGKLADFVILSEDIMNSNNSEKSLKNVEIVGTVLDGKIVYKNRNSDF